MAVTWKKLAYEDNVIVKSLLTTKGDIIYASSTSTPVRLGIGSNAQVLKVSTDVPAWADMGAPTAHKLNAHDAADGTVDFNLQQANDMVVKTVANEAALPVTDIGVGELCWATGEKSLHICSVAA